MLDPRRAPSTVDVPACVETMAAGFAGDPLCRWLHPDPGARAEAMRATFTLVLSAGLARGQVDVGPAGTAVAVWTPPGVELLDEPGRERFLAILGPTQPRGCTTCRVPSLVRMWAWYGVLYGPPASVRETVAPGTFASAAALTFAASSVESAGRASPRCALAAVPCRTPWTPAARGAGDRRAAEAGGADDGEEGGGPAGLGDHGERVPSGGG